MDDVTLAETSANQQQLQLQFKVQNLVHAMSAVGLLVNLKKSAWLVAGDMAHDEHIIIDGQQLPRVDCITLLGVDMGVAEGQHSTKFSARLATCNHRLSRITRLPVSEAA